MFGRNAHTRARRLSALSESEYSERHRALAAWFRQPLGAHLGATEREAVAEVLPDLFGYHLVMVSPPWDGPDMSQSRVRHRVVVQCRAEPGADLVALPEFLPVSGDSLDGLILPHTLELAGDPHQVLREADRCLVPEGHVVITGFNPLGLWGLWRLAARQWGQAPWSLRFIGLSRLRDWLGLLGFDIVHSRHLFFRPPLSGRARWADHLGCRHWSATAGGYLLVARKRVVAITPIRPRWRPRRLLAGGLEPTRRSPCNDG